MGDCRKSGEQLRAEAFLRGLALARILIFLGEGAPGSGKTPASTSPRHSNPRLLSRCGTPWRLARALFGEGEFAAAKQHAWASELKRSDAQGILEQAARLLAATPDLGEERQATVGREIAYFTTHAERTRYGPFRAQGYFIGSGVVEAGCKSVIGRRLKQSGMFWSEAGAENILQLRCLLRSPHFDAAWQARRPILVARQTKARRWKQAS